MLEKSTTSEEKWDLPVVTNRILLWMSSILEKRDINKEVISKIISLWLQIIESTHRTEYILRLILSWFKTEIDSSSIDVSPLLKNIQSYIKPTTFADYDITTTNTLYLPEIMKEGTQKPTNLREIRQRRIAAHKGFLYVAEPTTGLTKFGTGICGTVFASNERSSSFCINCDAHSLCVCDNHLLLGYQGQARGVIDVMSLESLERVGQLLCDTPIPQGPFTAAGDKLYIISKSVLYVYQKRGLKITPVYQIGLLRTEREYFPVPLQRDYEKYVTLITDGTVIGIVFSPFLIGNNQNPIYHQYSIQTGHLMQTEQKLEESLESMYIAVDLEGNTIIEAPYWDTVKVSNLSPVYQFNREYCNFAPTQINNSTQIQTQMSDDNSKIPLSLLNSLIPLLASRVSLKETDMSLPFSLQNTDLLFKLIDLMNEDKRYEVFSDACVLLLSIFEYQSAEYHDYTVADIFQILSMKNVSSSTRVNFMKSFVRGFNHKFLLTTKDCEKIIGTLTPEEISKIFATEGFHDIFGFLLAILNEKDKRVLKFLKEHVSEQYPFVNEMTFSLSRGVFVLDTIHCSAALPLFEIIKHANTYILPTLLAPILPLLTKMLEVDAIVAAVFPQLSTILASLEGLCSANHLQKYAKKHFESRVSNNFIETTVIEESKHPYENNSNYVHSYDFPGAVRIIITFDPQTETEEQNDFLQIFSDPECKEPISDKLSGTNEKWQKIIANCQHLSFQFTSDPSINLYGYKAYIQVKSFATTLAYKSPQSFYDLSRALFLLLLNVSKRYDSPPKGFEPETFSFPQGLEILDYSEDDARELLQKVGEKFDVENIEEEYLNYFNPCSSFPISYAYLKYVYENCTNDTGDIYYMLDLCRMHPRVAESKYHDISEMLSEIGALLIQNTLGLHDDMYHFLFSALKDSKGKSFALRSFKEAGVLCETPNPSFEIVLQAAAKIQIGLSIVGPHIIDEMDSDVIRKFLAAFRTVVIPVSAPSILRLNEKIRSIFTEIASSVDINSPFFSLVRENLALIDQTPPTASNPFVLFALAIADSLDKNRECDDFVLSVILLALPFNTTQIIPLIQSILKTFSFRTSINEKPELINILASIGKGFAFNITNATDHELFDIGPPFSFARAIIVREILDESKLDQLIPIIERNDETSLGALLVLSARLFPPHIHQQVVIKRTGKSATISSMDYLEYRFMNEDGLLFSIPALDVSSFEYTDIPFEPILPKPFGPVNETLIKCVMKLLDRNNTNTVNRRFAKSAVAELTHSTPLPFDVAKEFNTNFTKPLKSDNDKPVLELRHLLEGDTYICTKPVPCFSVYASPGMEIGYCSGTADTTFQSFRVLITPEKMISFPAFINQPVLKLESECITMGYFGQFKQLFIRTGSVFVMPPVYLSIFEEPSPFIKYKKQPKLFDPTLKCGAPTFLMKPLLPISSVFTHAIANNKLSSLFYEKLQFNGVTPNQIQFLPEISHLSNYTYFEFNMSAEKLRISIHPNTLRTVHLYEAIISKPKSNQTFGIMIHTKERKVFMTQNGEIMKDTLFLVTLNGPFTVGFELKGAETLSVNSNFTPFIFNVDRYFAQQPQSKKIEWFRPVLDKQTIPHSFSPIYTGKLPFNMMSICGENQNKADVRFERPCILTAADLDPKLFHRTATFTPIPGTDKANVKLINVRSQTWMSLDLPMTYIYSITDCSEPQNVFAAHERMQRSLKPFLSPWLFFPPNEMAQDNMCLLTPNVQNSFFIDNDNLYSCMIKSHSLVSNLSLFSDADLESTILELATVLGRDDFTGKCCEACTTLYSAVVRERPNVFDRLVNKAIDEVFCCDSFAMEKIIVSNTGNNTLVEVERRNSDCIYVEIRNSDFSLPISINDASLQSICSIQKSTDIGQCTMKGDMVTVQSLEKDEVLFLEILPISLRDRKKCFRHALQIISFIVQHCQEFGMVDAMHKIMLKLFEKIMKRETVLFGFVISEWLLTIVNKELFTDESLAQYSRLISLQTLRDTKDSQLAVSLAVFCVNVYVRHQRLSAKCSREALVNIIEPFMESNDNSIVGYVYSKIAADYISPFSVKGKIYDFLGDIRSPLITQFAFKCLLKSQKYAEKHVFAPIAPNNQSQSTENSAKSQTKQNEVINVDKSQNIYISFSEKIEQPKIKINDQFISDDCFFTESGNSDEGKAEETEQTLNDNDSDDESTTKTLDITILRDNESKDLTVTVFVEQCQRRASFDDFSQLFSIFRELRENWTEENEMFAASLSSSLLPNYMSLFSFEDSIFEEMFPNVSCAASRFRVSVLMQLSLLHSEHTEQTLHSSDEVKPYQSLLSPPIVRYNDKCVGQSCFGYIPISILSLTNFYIRVAQQFSVHSCFPGEKFIHQILLLNIKDPTTILRVVRTAKDDIFEAPVWQDDAALLPKADSLSLEELTAYFGFGFHMMMNARNGRSLPLPISAVVIRFAFGGRVVAKDFTDIDTEFAQSNPSNEEIRERIEPYMSQLYAIQCGVSMANRDGKKLFDADNPVFPSVMQLLPLTFPSEIDSEKVKYKSPAYIPLIRKQMFDQKVTLMSEEDRIDAIKEITKDFICN